VSLVFFVSLYGDHRYLHSFPTRRSSDLVELKGWNVYGGWRIGVRDIHNIYHYYAHLHQYDKELEIGYVVQPGETIGTVGSTGYVPPGTSGKFPPHLHYGMYRDNGKVEWSFDPYPYLKTWEQSDN